MYELPGTHTRSCLVRKRLRPGSARPLRDQLGQAPGGVSGVPQGGIGADSPKWRHIVKRIAQKCHIVCFPGGIGTEVFTGNAVIVEHSALRTKLRRAGCQSCISTATVSFNFSLSTASGFSGKLNFSRRAEKPHMTYSS